MIGAALRQMLITDSAIAALIGARVFPNALPQDSDGKLQTSLPAIAFREIASTPGNTMEGQDGLSQTRLELVVWGRSHAVAVSIAERVRRLLGAFSGSVAWAASPAGSLVIDSFDFSIGEQDVYSDELQLHGRQVEFYAWHSHSSPDGQEA